jgi:DNA-binding winged helix-turn-helix (wHTH) protein
MSSLTGDDKAEGMRAGLVSSRGSGEILAFRRFQVVPSARQLLVAGHEVEIGGRAFDLLVVLLEARGTVVDKVRIFQRVWPSIAVDESNLRFQMGVLRRVLGADRDAIKTVAGRGYMLVDERPLDQAAVLANEPEGNDLALSDPPHGTTDEEIDDGLSNISEMGGAPLGIPSSALVRIRALEQENDCLRRAVADLIIGRLPVTGARLPLPVRRHSLPSQYYRGDVQAKGHDLD